MIKKGVIITLGVVFLLSSVPFTTAQSLTQFNVWFNSTPGYRDYQVIANEIRVDGSLMTDGIIDNPIFNFIGGTPHVADDGGDLFWYDFAWSAFFEANDTNKDGVFTLGVDQHVGAIVPLSYRWESWNYSDFLLELQGGIVHLQVAHDPDLSPILGVTDMHVNHTANMTITHQHDRLVRSIDGWSGVPGHMRSMDIEIEIRALFNSSMRDQFNLNYQVSGWDWTYNDSILVFIFNPHVRIHDSLDPESDSVRDFLAVKHVGSRFYFGEGFVEYSQKAFAGNAMHQIEVNASEAEIREDELDPFHEHYVPVIFTAFENFGNETLEYDINLGIDSNVDLPTTPTIPDISYDELLLTASIISMFVIALIFYRNSKNARGNKAQRSWIGNKSFS